MLIPTHLLLAVDRGPPWFFVVNLGNALLEKHILTSGKDLICFDRSASFSRRSS